MKKEDEEDDMLDEKIQMTEAIVWRHEAQKWAKWRPVGRPLTSSWKSVAEEEGTDSVSTHFRSKIYRKYKY